MQIFDGEGDWHFQPPHCSKVNCKNLGYKGLYLYSCSTHVGGRSGCLSIKAYFQRPGGREAAAADPRKHREEQQRSSQDETVEVQRSYVTYLSETLILPHHGNWHIHRFWGLGSRHFGGPLFSLLQVIVTCNLVMKTHLDALSSSSDLNELHSVVTLKGTPEKGTGEANQLIVKHRLHVLAFSPDFFIWSNNLSLSPAATTRPPISPLLLCLSSLSLA